jgi:hypothetical protein
METEGKIAALEEKASRVKAKLLEVGPMRPGKLSRQYKDPKAKQGGYWQLSYTYQMKSRSEYVRPESVKRIRQETGAFKRFKGLVEELISLELRISTLRTELEKGRK